jgi:hypothetical protein
VWTGVGILCGMGSSDCVRGGDVVVGLLVRAAYAVGVCSGRSVFFMYVCHEGCMSVVSVCDLWVVCDVLSLMGGAVWSVGCLWPFGAVFWAGSFALWEFREDGVCGLYVVCKSSGGSVFMVSRLLYVYKSVSQSGARCLRSLLEYLMGFEFLSYQRVIVFGAHRAL